MLIYKFCFVSGVLVYSYCTFTLLVGTSKFWGNRSWWIFFNFCGSIVHFSIWHPSIYQVPCLMALAIMSFQTSPSRAADILSVTLPAPNQDFRLSSIFALCLPLLLLFIYVFFFCINLYKYQKQILKSFTVMLSQHCFLISPLFSHSGFVNLFMCYHKVFSMEFS